MSLHCCDLDTKKCKVQCVRWDLGPLGKRKTHKPKDSRQNKKTGLAETRQFVYRNLNLLLGTTAEKI